MTVLGAVMAGGRNTRFGDLKAFAEINGEPIIERVITALRSAADDVVLIANDVQAYAGLQLPIRSDLIPDLGALGGIHAALHWAQERAAGAILAVACDMPFPSVSLLRELRELGTTCDAVLPESDGRRGVEPLFAYYAVRCLHAIEEAIARGDRRMIGFHDEIAVQRMPLERVRQHGDPEVLFANVNSRADLERARRIAEGSQP